MPVQEVRALTFGVEPGAATAGVDLPAGTVEARRSAHGCELTVR